MTSILPKEHMTVAAARLLQNDDVCFVGIGAPSAACNLARLTHAPDITLIYESGTIATMPDRLPLSIGDGELHDTALTTVSVPEMFQYWLQGDRISIGFLGAAQLDRRGNLNTTVIGDYSAPKVRLPGGGGAPEIATQAREIFITAEQSKRTFVDKIDFLTSLGHGQFGESRAAFDVHTKGPTRLVTDLAIWEMQDPEGRGVGVPDFHAEEAEFVVVSLHEGITRDDISSSVGWTVKFAPRLKLTRTPTPIELDTLRALNARSAQTQQE